MVPWKPAVAFQDLAGNAMVQVMLVWPSAAAMKLCQEREVAGDSSMGWLE